MMRQVGLAFGPREPDLTRLARHMYYQRLRWLWELEERITRTESGLAFVMRLKRIGHAG